MTEDDINIHVGRALRERRETLGMTLVQLGAAVGVSSVTVWKWEDGRRAIRIAQLLACARALGAPLDGFLPTGSRTAARRSVGGRVKPDVTPSGAGPMPRPEPEPRPGPENRSGEATRLALIAAARRSFTTLPYDQATLTEIARDAGCDKATTYIHFSDKADLWRAAMDSEPPDADVMRLRHEETARALRRLCALHRGAVPATDPAWSEAWAHAGLVLPPTAPRGRIEGPAGSDHVVSAFSDMLRQGVHEHWSRPTFEDLSSGFTELCRLLIAQRKNAATERQIYHQALRAAALALRAARLGVEMLPYRFRDSHRRRSSTSGPKS